MRGNQSFSTQAQSNDPAALDVGPNYPFSAQYKGDGWYVYNALTNEYSGVRHEKAYSAEAAAGLAKAELVSKSKKVAA